MLNPQGEGVLSKAIGIDGVDGKVGRWSFRPSGSAGAEVAMEFTRQMTMQGDS
jgi:hypothetical protein